MPDSVGLARSFGGGAVLAADDNFACLEFARGLVLIEAWIDPNTNARAT